MKEVPLNKGYVALVDDQDYGSVVQFRWRARVYRRADETVKNVYAERSLPRNRSNPKNQFLHRFILGVKDPRIAVDHKDHDGLNCCRSNIRIATNSQNQQNRKVGCDNRIGLKGVAFHERSQKWQAHIFLQGHQIYLGLFETPREAALAYDKAAIAHWGEFANVNFR